MTPVNFSDFKQVVFSVARLINGRVSDIQDSSGIPNFFVAKLESHEESLYLLSTFTGEWALAQTLSPNIEFVDSSRLADLFVATFGICILESEYLKGGFAQQEGMLESDIKYWKPKTMGEAIFNWWD